jgi:ATP-dependent Clp protease ATP-binding subunit ClpC
VRTERLRFDEEAHDLLQVARHEAASLGHEYVGVEHLLLAIAIVDPDALASRGIQASPEALRSEVERLLTAGPNSSAQIKEDWLALSPLLADVFSQAREAAENDGDDVGASQHFLVAILNHPDTIAARVLEATPTRESSSE